MTKRKKKNSNAVRVGCYCGWRGKRVLGECACYEVCQRHCAWGSCPKCKARVMTVECIMSDRRNAMLVEGVERIHVPRYRCVYCKRLRSSKKAALEHARHCFKNDWSRTPRIGEITSVADTGRSVSADGSAYGLPHPVLEWRERTMPAWWPGEGKIWDGKEWLDVPGYQVGYATGAHMHADGPPPIETWPLLGEVPLDEVRPLAHRLRVLDVSLNILPSNQDLVEVAF